MNIRVVPRRIAKEILADFEQWKNYDYLISFNDPEEKALVLPTGESIAFHFYDYNAPQYDKNGKLMPIPEIEDMERLISFIQTHKEGKYLIHCYAGVARSPAAAFIALCVHYGLGQEERAMQEVVSLRPQCQPNYRMIELADQLLNRNGAMVAALADRIGVWL